MVSYGFCTYNETGDLFVDGTGASTPFNLAEMRKDDTRLTNVTVTQPLTLPAGLQWYGRHLAISNDNVIYSFAIRRGSAREVGETPLSNTSEAVQFALQDGTAIVPGVQSNNIDFYRYPRGGTPGKTILLFHAISASVSTRSH